MNGKGDKDRTADRKSYNNNYDKIDWTKKIKKKFKTSWGVEYTVNIKDEPSKKDSTPTINDLTKKS
jgi:hypothetical protein